MSTKNEIWLTYNNESGKFLFPVNPEKITVICNGKIDTVDVVGLGEILVKQDRPAVSVSWQGFLPATYFPGANYRNLARPYSSVELINGWKNSDGVCHLIVTDTPVNLFVLIDKFKVWEQGGDVETVYYDISFKEFRYVGARKISVVGTTAVIDEGAKRVDNRVTPSSYTVTPGENLWTIARKVWGDGARWREIYDANKSSIKNPDLIYPGQVVVIPG